jgi:hypothetical protein
VAAQIEAWTRPGEVVLDLNGRGGWIARAAIAAQRCAADFESLSLTRQLADVVVRPPDVRHLEAAARAISVRPLGEATVRKTIDDLFGSTCPDCKRPVVLEWLVWEPGEAGATAGPGAPATAAPAGAAVAERPVRREYRCEKCQKAGGPELRQAEPTADDLARAAFSALPDEARENLRKRFPTPHPNDRLPDQLIDLHTPRQLLGLNAILEGIELETRSVPLMAALRLAFLHAVASAGRRNAHRGRPPALRISKGALKFPAGRAWNERNPWSAFEEGLALVRGFIERLEAEEQRTVNARLASDLLELHDGAANLMMGESTPGSLRRIGQAGERIAESGSTSRVRLILGQAPLLMSPELLAQAYSDTAWALGAGAASMLPFERLFRPVPRGARRGTAEDLARALARSLAVAGPTLALNGHAVVLLDDGEPRNLVAAALGGAAAGYRLVEARLNRAAAGSPGLAVFVPPTGIIEPGPRTRANRPLPPVSGGAGDPGAIAGQGIFTAPEKLREGAFRPSVAAQAVNDTAVEMLKARGEPASFENMLGDLLVGLDRSGQLARFACQFRPAHADQGWQAWIESDGQSTRESAAEPEADRDATAGAEAPDAGCESPSPETGLAAPAAAALTQPAAEEPEPPEPAGPVDELLAVIRGELDRATNRRIRQIEPGQYWLGSEDDRLGSAQPLADRVEWAVFSLLSSSHQMTETAVFERTTGLFGDREAPDGELLAACLASYTAPGSTPDAIATADRLERRSAEHDAMIATIAELGHRLGMRVWIGRRQRLRRVNGRPLAEWLDEEEREAEPTAIAWGPEAELERVDCAWYVRHKAAFLFEVEWTAMLGDAVLVRHGRFPNDDRVVRFMAIPPERKELVRHKLARSPLLRRAFAERNWHIFKWDQLVAFAERAELSLADLEPFLGLDADAADRQQLPLFEA